MKLGTPRLLAYDLKTGKTEDLGEMRLEDGRRIIGTFTPGSLWSLVDSAMAGQLQTRGG